MSYDWFWCYGNYTGDNEDRIEQRLVDKQEVRQLELLKQEKAQLKRAEKALER